MRVLISLLCAPNARPIKKLCCADMNLSPDGINALAALITLHQKMEYLNIGNTVVLPKQHIVFLRLAAAANR